MTYGMQAGVGAIESVRTRPDGGFDCDVIGAGEARGLCGSGLVDLLAELRRSGRMTPKGVFADRAREVSVVPGAGITLSRADGSALVHDVLVQGLTMEQVGQRRGLCTKRWSDYFSRRFRECLDRLALLYGFATEHPVPVKSLPR